MRGSVATAGVARDLRGARQHGLNRGFFLVRNQLHRYPITYLWQLSVVAARFVDEFAGDLRGEFRVYGPDTIKMFILHRDARRNKTLSEKWHELFVALRVPAQLLQAHRRRLVKMLGITES